MSNRHPWTAFYWDDWHKDTAHLSHVQYSIYHRLLAHYYRTGKPLVANATDLARICLAIGKAEQAALQAVLERFFTLEGDEYHNRRADMEIAKSLTISKKRAKSGSQGGQAKAGKSVANATQMPAQSHPQSQLNSGGYAEPLDEQIVQIARLYPKIHDPLHLSNEVSYSLAEAIARDGFDRVWAGTRSMAETVAKWPVEEKQYIPSPSRFFRESHYRKDPREWERSINETAEKSRPSASAERSERSKRNILHGFATNARHADAPDGPECEVRA